ncbi:Gfo/Idh/MocA family protein [Algisphaera agarilytica]|uniref:Putative dehydrogenase n=1 Tax=Algisphaera agarilytica TaxID=1385975 RepID=A0A7X0H7L3_9BACT|nr:Gfo/Idh/MocA family oxidoreductase [Algisphaera agarilytica]MBB6429591.1 putative dehydrogenase [Algisphaera agarilytica]
MSDQAMKRVGLVGCGARALDHLASYRGLAGTQVVACCAPSPRRRDPFAAEHGLKAYADPAEMIRAESLDVVHLITGPESRIALMTLVSDLGVPFCVVEKPIAIGVAGWRALCELSEKTSTVFATCHQLRWYDTLCRIRDAAQAGEFGELQSVDFSAGMTLAGQGTHLLHYARSLVGDPLVKRISATAQGWDTSDGYHPAPLGTRAELEFDNGITATWVSGPDAPRCGDPDVVWQHMRIGIRGSRGHAEYQEFARWHIQTESRRAEGDFGGFEHAKVINRAGQQNLYADMLRGESPTGLPETLHEWKVVLALYTSALAGRPIDLDGFVPDDDLIERMQQRSA